MNDVLLQIIFSGIVAISTVVYAILTYKLVKETKLTREFQLTPDIQIYFERGEASWRNIYIVFENLGYGTATNVKFKILKDYGYYENKIFHLSEKGIIKNGINKFYPKQKFQYLLGNLYENYENKIKEEIIIQVEYYDITKKLYTNTINLSLLELEGMGDSIPPDNNLGRISYYLNEIHKTIKKTNQ